jgi:hypothetical protein
LFLFLPVSDACILAHLRAARLVEHAEAHAARPATVTVVRGPEANLLD